MTDFAINTNFFANATAPPIRGPSESCTVLRSILFPEVRAHACPPPPILSFNTEKITPHPPAGPPPKKTARGGHVFGLAEKSDDMGFQQLIKRSGCSNTEKTKITFESVKTFLQNLFFYHCWSGKDRSLMWGWQAKFVKWDSKNGLEIKHMKYLSDRTIATIFTIMDRSLFYGLTTKQKQSYVNQLSEDSINVDNIHFLTDGKKIASLKKKRNIDNLTIDQLKSIKYTDFPENPSSYLFDKMNEKRISLDIHKDDVYSLPKYVRSFDAYRLYSLPEVHKKTLDIETMDNEHLKHLHPIEFLTISNHSKRDYIKHNFSFEFLLKELETASWYYGGETIARYYNELFELFGITTNNLSPEQQRKIRTNPAFFNKKNMYILNLLKDSFSKSDFDHYKSRDDVPIDMIPYIDQDTSSRFQSIENRKKALSTRSDAPTYASYLQVDELPGLTRADVVYALTDTQIDNLKVLIESSHTNTYYIANPVLVEKLKDKGLKIELLRKAPVNKSLSPWHY